MFVQMRTRLTRVHLRTRTWVCLFHGGRTHFFSATEALQEDWQTEQCNWINPRMFSTVFVTTHKCMLTGLQRPPVGASGTARRVSPIGPFSVAAARGLTSFSRRP